MGTRLERRQPDALCSRRLVQLAATRRYGHWTLWWRIVRFAPLPNPGVPGPPVFDAVPTSVRIYGNQLLMSLLTGFPFVPGLASVLTVDPETGAVGPFINGLTSVTDVLWRDRGSGRSQFLALEFSVNQSLDPAPPGRLLRFDTPAAEVAVPIFVRTTPHACVRFLRS